MNTGRIDLSSKNARGFSLIELLIVVAIILIIAAIAIPNLLRSKMAANEASSVSAMRTLATAQATFASTYGRGYAPGLANLGDPGGGACVSSYGQGCLLDPVLTQGIKSGYTFNVSASNGSGTPSDPFLSYLHTATPKKVGTTGMRMFCSDESGVIRFDVSGAGCDVHTSSTVVGN